MGTRLNGGNVGVWPHCAAYLLCLVCEGVGLPGSELDCCPDISPYCWGASLGLWKTCVGLKAQPGAGQQVAYLCSVGERSQTLQCNEPSADRTGGFLGRLWSLCCLLNEWKVSLTRCEGTLYFQIPLGRVGRDTGPAANVFLYLCDCSQRQLKGSSGPSKSPQPSTSPVPSGASPQRAKSPASTPAMNAHLSCSPAEAQGLSRKRVANAVRKVVLPW